MTTSSAVKTRASVPCPGSAIEMIGRFADIVRKRRGSSRKRRIALGLDERTLRDIGLTRLQVTYREATMSLHQRTAHQWS